jgi:ribonuclease P protein component
MIATFPKSKRLRSAEDFKHVFNRAKRVSNRHLGLYYCKNDLEGARLGVVVSKKNVRKAHDRNRFKRLARESFRKKQLELGCCDFVIVAYKGVEAYETQELKHFIDELWSKYSVIYKKPLSN